ncbi:alpha-glucosidase (family GH31 glycosyl hydrolase) [Flavobacterium sp. 28A]|uniref:glycoside hydrolase family 31 protein n=1 Tax=Flavobacterium sp. 28A TaxID=2735895 RepID=UPI00156DEC2A|nr:TIM-barrel domain-containing protein [Flavobacterium sp. 28A]NRT16036.1 alpha-glucosidase (family GH31 glycosyl hydrolase) [Flavobacterium sp. 28A]
MNKFLLSIILLVFTITFSFAQNANRKYEGHATNKNTLEVNTSDGKYIFTPYATTIIATTFIPKGETNTTPSHAVVMQVENGIAKIKETKNSLTFSTKGISVKLTKSPFQISYFYKSKALLSEKNGYIKKDSTEVLDFNLDNSEALYGAGERVLGMNRRGNRLQLYNRAHYGYETHSELMNFTMPLVMSSKIYAVHFDNAAIGYLDLDSKKDNTLAYETISGRKTYQVIAADSWTDLITSYTTLTGKQPLPPRWAFGNFASRFGYHTQAETEATIQKYRDEKIPVDAVILDLYWFGKTVQGTMGNLDWDKESFPEPTNMIANLEKAGVKTILITEPFILTTSSKWQEAVDKKILATDSNGKPFTYDFYFGNTGIIDIFKPEGKQWFWTIYKNLINQGVAGLWGDLGEPEVFPSAAITVAGKADEVHNIYGHNWAKLVQDGYKKDFAQQRPFILMRAGYSGSQRYGMIPWSGDVSRSWGGLQAQTEIALQMGMQGLGYMHSDLGGFAGATDDSELYTRWLQYGVFQPIFRPHAQEDVPSEPIFKDEITKNRTRKAIELRYQMIPYNYTLAFENNQKGTPLMRPLLFEEPTDTVIQKVNETYLWGNDFLVTPITHAGIASKTIYFPKSSNWFDFYSDKKYAAATTENIAVVPEQIPVFVRGGAFIPMADLVQTTRDYTTSKITLHYYKDSDVKASSGRMYHDDGKTPEAFEKGNYEILHFNAKNKSNILSFELTTTIGANYTAIDRQIQLIIHNSDAEPKKITSNRKAVDFNWNKKEKTLTIPVQWTKGTSEKIKIKF